MFILDQPYVSKLLQETVITSGMPVLANDTARKALDGTNAHLCAPEEFIRLVKEQNSPRVYSNSENAIEWINSHLEFTDLPGKISGLKDKVRFRELLGKMYPGYYFQSIAFEDLDALDPGSVPKPFVIKPATGFFSLGVHIVHQDHEWETTLAAIKEQVACVRDMYPAQVLDLGRFIIEEYIEGEEFAVDAYYDAQGKPVILNILAHLFASEKDVSDRVYYTSANVIETWREPFLEVLEKMGAYTGLSDFPVHVELRADKKGNIAPIEFNPMRFAGWCCTDIAHFAYGFNPYTTYLEGKRPDWKSILPSRKDSVYAIVVADLPASMDRTTIKSVDYEAFAAHFSKPLDLRPVDYATYSVFAFMFAQVPQNNMHELETILQSDLQEYLTLTTS